MEPNDNRPLLEHDLSHCARCGAEAVGWRPGAAGVAEGRCAEHMGPAVEIALAPERHRSAR